MTNPALHTVMSLHFLHTLYSSNAVGDSYFFPYSVAGDMNCLGSIMHRTNESRGVSAWRCNTCPNREAVRGDLCCSLVLLSISLMLSSDTQRLSVKAVTLSNNCCLLGRSIADSVAILPDRTWVEGSARIEIPNPFPLTFSRKSGKYLLNVPRNSGGLGYDSLGSV